MNPLSDQALSAEQDISNYILPQFCPKDFMANYDLLSRIKSLKGAIVSCGVDANEMLMHYAILDSFNNKNMFLAFEGHTKKLIYDCSSLPFGNLEYKIFQCKIDKSPFQIIRNQNNSHLRIQFISNYIGDAIPQYLIENPELKISYLKINLDDYEATLTTLQYFYPRLETGGIIVLDNYYKKDDDYQAASDYFFYDKIIWNTYDGTKALFFIVKS